MEKITTTLKNLPTWALVLIGVLILALLALAAVLVVRRLRKSKATAPPPPEFKKNRLSMVKKHFLARLPAAVREWPYAVVLGELGVGKSHLIDSHADWRAAENQLLHSVERDPLVQLYLGDRLILEEIAPTVLRDTSDAMRRALKALWKPLARQHPIVLVAVDARHLLGVDAEASLRELGQLVRGKLHLLWQIRGAPVPVRLCITHLDRVGGYSEFIRLVRGQGLEPVLGAEAALDRTQRSAWLDPYMRYLPLGLTTLVPDAFDRLVSFYTHGGELLGALEPLIQALVQEDPLVPPVSIERIHPSGLAHDEQPGKPFAVDRAVIATDQAGYLARHRVRCLGLAAVAAAVFLGLFTWHRQQVKRAWAAVDAFRIVVDRGRLEPGGPSLSLQRDAARAELDTAASLRAVERSAAVFPLLQGSYTRDKAALRSRFTGGIREQYLLPPFARPRDTGLLLRALGLVYASRNSELASLILPAQTTWASQLKLPEAVIADYIEQSDRPWEGTVTLPPRGGEVTEMLTRFEPWIAFFDHLQSAYASATLDSATLAALGREAEPLRQALEEVRPVHEASALVSLLVRGGWLDLDALLGPAAGSDTVSWIRSDFAALDGILGMIQRSSLALDLAAAKLPLGRFMMRLPALVSVGRAPEASYLVQPRPGRRYTFATEPWRTRIEHARLRGLLDAYQEAHRSDDADLFVPADARYPDLPATSGGRGPTLTVAGRYSRAAIEGDAIPALEPIAQQLQSLGLTEAEQVAFRQFVADGTERYARACDDQLFAYYDSYRYRASSVDSLRQGLAALRSPGSNTEQFLSAAAQNAAPKVGASAYGQQIADELGYYAPLVTVMTPDKGRYPQLEPYLAILAMLDAALDGTLPAGSVGAVKDGLPIAASLAPAGQVALDMLLGTKASQLAAARQWTAAAGLDDALARPFLLPFYRAFELGIPDVEAVVEAEWRKVAPAVSAALARFPFHRSATETITPAELEAVLGPQGQFQRFFDRFVAPLCLAHEGGWSLRPSPHGPSVKLPAGLLDLANALGRMQRVLWNDKGAARPLTVQIKALPLPAISSSSRSAATIASLRVGTTVLYGFNQTPLWQTLTIDWTSSETACAVSVELKPLDVGQNEYRSLDVTAAPWSWHRLLARGELSRQLVLTWQLTDGSGQTPQAVRYTFGADPWSPFDVAAAATAAARTAGSTPGSAP